jgi:phosphoribosylamine--glycine ligase
MESDLLEWFGACAEGTLVDYPRDVPFKPETAVYVVAAAPGYPDSPKTGQPYMLHPAAFAGDDYRFAGLRAEKGGWVISGGRVLGALGLGKNADAARSDAYAKLEHALFEGAQIRKDIGR